VDSEVKFFVAGWLRVVFVLPFLCIWSWVGCGLIGAEIFGEFSGLAARDGLAGGLHLAYFRMLGGRSGTRLFPKRLVWSGGALFPLQIGEVQFLGGWGCER